MRKNILIGLYVHYKGGIYDVLGTATHTENLKKRLVVYRDENKKMWARPERMFRQKVRFEGRSVPRFTKIEEN